MDEPSTTPLAETFSQFDNAIPGWLRWFIGIGGGALTTTGAVAVFETNNTVGSSSLVVAGVAVVALSTFANKLQTIKAGDYEFIFAATAAKQLAAAQKAERSGETEMAASLRDQAAALLSATKPMATEFDAVRSTMPRGLERSRSMERIVNDAKNVADQYSDPTAIETLFDTGTGGNRISAIAIMEQKPELASARVAEAALTEPRSKFEQWHALSLVRELTLRSPDSSDVAHLHGVIRRLLKEGRFGEDTDRQVLGQRILAKRGQPSEPDP